MKKRDRSETAANAERLMSVTVMMPYESETAANATVRYCRMALATVLF
uniref:Uncharacterized protein n=1 Tax=uncultured bacterium A1Q1_fos_1815 TaxID=1256553 RepID=L7VZ41_9BACT|nr:hypothetical protein [uncultured bacterium A1Q1_fos_1815]